MTELETSTLDDLTVEVAGLRDLFQRRLLDDRNQKQLYDELSKRLYVADGHASMQLMAPLLRQLLLVIDRIGASGEKVDPMLESVRQEPKNCCTDKGSVPIGPVRGTPFDPKYHQVVSVVEVEGLAGRRADRQGTEDGLSDRWQAAPPGRGRGRPCRRR